MSLSEQYFSTDEIHPIDIVEHLAEHHEWDFDRVADDQIAMAVEGQRLTASNAASCQCHQATKTCTPADLCTHDNNRHGAHT